MLLVPRRANPGDLYTEPPGLVDKDHLLSLSERSLSIAHSSYYTTVFPSIFILPKEEYKQQIQTGEELRLRETCNCYPVLYEILKLFHSSPKTGTEVNTVWASHLFDRTTRRIRPRLHRETGVSWVDPHLLPNYRNFHSSVHVMYYRFSFRRLPENLQLSRKKHIIST